MENMRVKLSTLWVFATLNYLYADVIALFDLVGSKRATTGNTGPPHMTQGVLLGIAIFMEIPIAMVVLSRVLKYRANRWANIIAGTIETAAVVLSTVFFPILNGTPPTLYYLFLGTIEVVCTSLIVWYAWKWPKEAGESAVGV